jgi:hypothetical protein
MWTSPAKIGFQAIVVHWVDTETRCVETALLSLKEFKGAHGGEEQAEVFLQVIREAGLQDQLGFFTSDNHGSNDLMLRHIAEEIKDFNPVLRRVHYFGHNLNRIAQAFLFGSIAKQGEGQKDEDEAIDIAIQDITKLQDELQRQGSRSKEDITKEFRKHGSLGKLHNCNAFSRSSFSRFQALLAVVGRAIPMDNDTRWNSWLDEVTVALQKRKEFMSWTEDHWQELGDDALTRDDWQELEDIKEILQPFKTCTKNTEGHTATLYTTFNDMEFLIRHFTQMREKFKGNAQITARLIAAWYKFDKYYKLTDDTPVHAAAALLHPQLREAYLKKVWSTREQQKWIKPTITKVRNLWRDYFKPESAQLIDLNSIKDPAARFLAEMTISTAASDEFDEFTKVYL